MRALLILLFVALGLGGVAALLFTQQVPADHVARGEAGDLKPGLRQVLPWKPTTLLPTRGQLRLEGLDRVMVKTAEGHAVGLDLSFPWAALAAPPEPGALKAAARKALQGHLAGAPLASLLMWSELDERLVAAGATLKTALKPLGVGCGQVRAHGVKLGPEVQMAAEALREADLSAAVERARADLGGARTKAREAKEAADRQVAAVHREWDAKEAALRAERGKEIAELEAEQARYTRRRSAEAEGIERRMRAEASKATASAAALRDRLASEVLSGPGGRIYIAVEAARRFELGSLALKSADPEFLRRFGSIQAWRRFFLEEAPKRPSVRKPAAPRRDRAPAPKPRASPPPAPR